MSSVKIHIQKGSLSVPDSNGKKLDYHISSPIQLRHKILNKIVKTKNGDAIGVYRALLARRTLGKNRLRGEQINTLTDDANYVKQKYYYTKNWAKNPEKHALPLASRRSQAYAKKVIIPVKKGGLTVDGLTYHIKSPLLTRHKILNKLVKAKPNGALGIYRAILARRTLGKNRLSEADQIVLTQDAEYLKKKYAHTNLWNKKKPKTASAYDMDNMDDDDDDDESDSEFDSSSDDDDNSSSSSSSSESDEYR